MISREIELENLKAHYKSVSETVNQANWSRFTLILNDEEMKYEVAKLKQ